MPDPSARVSRLRFVEDSPVPGLAVARRRVEDPRASVILVHGALDRGGSFARVVRRLDGFDAVIYDRRGYQGSRALTPVDFEHHVDDLGALIEDEAMRNRVILFGHSFGGDVTFAAALRMPERVGLVVNYESPLPWILRRDVTRPPLSDDAKVEAERFFRRVMSDTAWDKLSDVQRESRRLDGPALLVDLATVQSATAPFDLSLLRVPATYAHGDLPAPEYYRALSAAIEGVNPSIDTIELRHATHAAHLRNAEQLASLIKRRWDETCASG